MINAEQCRAKAAECAELALKSQYTNQREFYRDLARRWREAAERLRTVRKVRGSRRREESVMSLENSGR